MQTEKNSIKKKYGNDCDYKINTDTLSASELEEFMSELFQIVGPKPYVDIDISYSAVCIIVKSYWLVLYNKNKNTMDTRLLNVLLQYNIDIDPCVLAIIKLSNRLSDESKLKIELDNI